MYNHEIEYQVNALIEAEIISSKHRKKAFKVLRDKCWTDKIAVVWGIDDVQARALEDDMEISDEDAREVLDTMLDNHDANIGINWNTIDCYMKG